MEGHGIVDEVRAGEPAALALRLDPFVLVCAASLVLMLAVSFDYGITGDEPEQQRYGHLVYAYYRSGFTDRSVLSAVLHMYGGLFEILCVVAERLSPLPVFDTRHLVNAAVGWVGIVYAGAIARRLMGTRAACLTVVLLLLSPQYFAHCMNNPKDIPFATAYTASIYYLLAIRPQYPFLGPGLFWKNVAAIASAIGVRFGGLLLVCYLWLVLALRAFRARRIMFRDAAPLALRAAAASVLAIAIGCMFCPWALQNPVARPLEALSALENFKDADNIPVLFAGQSLRGTTLPSRYVPTMLALTTPVTVLVAGLASVLLLARLRGEQRFRLGVVWLAFLFPLLYVTATRAPVYNGIRHLLFVYPAFAVLAAAGCETILRWVERDPMRRFAAAAVLGVGLADPLRFHLANHPNQAVYFNALAGGVPGAFERYDLDYWGNCVKQALGWIEQRAEPPPGRRIRVGGAQWPLKFVMDPYVEEGADVTYVPGRDPRRADVWIDTFYGDQRSRQRARRRDRVLHEVTADGVPLCIVAKGGG